MSFSPNTDNFLAFLWFLNGGKYLISESNNNSYHDGTSAFFNACFPRKIPTLMPLINSSLLEIGLSDFYKVTTIVVS